MGVTYEEIETYLSDVKTAIGNDRYRLENNLKRLDNRDLFWDYVIDEAKAKEILLSLTVSDFSEKIKG